MNENVAAAPVSSYAVRQIRGPFLALPEHPGHAASDRDLATLCSELRAQGVPLAADLFSGAGGMSLGLEEAGFRVVLGVDHDSFAVETHRHHFAGMSMEEDMANPATVADIAKLLKRNKVELLAGGPPCQPFSRRAGRCSGFGCSQGRLTRTTSAEICGGRSWRWSSWPVRGL